VSKTVLKTTFAFLSLSLATFLLGCGEEPVPLEPGFAADVRPIFVARCVRCHGAGGMLNGDPLYKNGAPPTGGYFAQYDDSGNCAAGAPLAGCMHGAKFYAKVLKAYIYAPPDMRMPPLPAEGLSDRQLEILDRWAAEATPKP
jgi:hypothetical protein